MDPLQIHSTLDTYFTGIIILFDLLTNKINIMIDYKNKSIADLSRINDTFSIILSQDSIYRRYNQSDKHNYLSRLVRHR